LTSSPDGRDIVVIGASAGGVVSLQQLVAHLPPDFPAAMFVVLHVSESGTSVLPNILSRAGVLPASHAVHGERIRTGHIYIAPPGNHLTLELGRVRVTRGARENGHRPAIDPLFRSAALVYGSRVIGVILSGSLDDGTLGLRDVKNAGGLAIVQDPADTAWPSMPESAVRNVRVDHCARPAEIGKLLTRLVGAPAPVGTLGTAAADLIAHDLKGATTHEDDRDTPGTPSPYSCPECGGVLWQVPDGEPLRFQCRVGHAYASDSLSAEQTRAIEKALWAALRALEEHASLKRRLGERAKRHGRDAVAERFEERARELTQQAEEVRTLLLAGVGAVDE
jgi:two-component system chemotaxis response regulator CheB